MLINVGVYFLLQPTAEDPRSIEFTYENAAIPCELTTGEPLSVPEITGRIPCTDDEPFPAYFHDKGVFGAVVASMFLHGGFLHLAGNMLYLWVFGNNVEDRLGIVRYL